MASPPPHLVAFGLVVRRRRRHLDLSQEALAHLSGISAKHIGEIERAKKDPRLTTIVRLLEPLGVTGEELCDLIHTTLPAR